MLTAAQRLKAGAIAAADEDDLAALDVQAGAGQRREPPEKRHRVAKVNDRLHESHLTVLVQVGVNNAPRLVTATVGAGMDELVDERADVVEPPAERPPRRRDWRWSSTLRSGGRWSCWRRSSPRRCGGITC